MYLSTDNGTSWTQTSLNNQYVYSLAANGNNVFAGTGNSGNGVYVSTDNGTSWIQRNEGMGNFFVRSLFVFNNYIFAGINLIGAWRRPLGELVGTQPISNEIPEHFVLEQNYPNPFNPTTNIKFSLPKNANVRLVIYDILGKEVETLVNELLKPGTYEVSFDGSNIASGLYSYKLQVGYYVEMKKMILLK